MRQWLLGFGFGIGLLCLSSGAAMAKTIEFKLFPLVDTQNARCPDKIVAYQTAKPYQEGSFTSEGTVLLGAIATQVSVAKVDPFSVIWVGTLKPPYQGCRASAGVFKVDGQPSSDLSYLRMQFVGGKVYFILDMTGMRDANGYTTTILRKEIVKGNPRWQWGGTD